MPRRHCRSPVFLGSLIDFGMVMDINHRNVCLHASHPRCWNTGKSHRSGFIQFWERPRSFEESVKLCFDDAAMRRRHQQPVTVFVALIEFFVADRPQFRRFTGQERLKPASIADVYQKWSLAPLFVFGALFSESSTDRLIEKHCGVVDQDLAPAHQL
jgi:hypothetical protein